MQIKKEFKDLVPDLTEEEFEQLEKNCLEDGILESIKTWNGFIIDGHNRFEIANKNNLSYETKEMQFENENEVIDWIILHQLGRRNLTESQKSYLRGVRYENEKLKVTNSSGVNQFNKEVEDQNDPHPKTAEKLADEYNVSEPTIKRDANFSKGVDTISKAKPESRNEILNEKTDFTKGDIQSFAPIEKQAEREVKSTSIFKTDDELQAEIDKKARELTKQRLEEIEANKKHKKEKRRKKALEQVALERVDVKISDNIKQGDSLEILGNLPDGSIDIVLTDPPYGISYKSNRSIYDDSVTKQGLLNDGKDDAFNLLDESCQILKKKTAKNAHLYFFCSWSVFSDFQNIISKYFTIKTPIVWNKGNKGSGDLDNDWGNQTEIIIFCVKGKKYLNTRRGNVIDVPKIHSSKMIHPTQKPNELLKQILDVSYVDGDFIVDPFMGSGSTIKVANELNADSLGIELDKEMFNKANLFING